MVADRLRLSVDRRLRLDGAVQIPRRRRSQPDDELPVVILVVVSTSRVVRVVLEVELDRVPLPIHIWWRQVYARDLKGQIGGQVDARAAILDAEAPARRRWTAPRVEPRQVEH